MRMKIVENKAKCLKCGDVIESIDRHNYVQCSCGNISVDGGLDYLKRSYRDGMDTWIDLSISEPIEEDGNSGKTL
jgi:hypothetical protein